MHGIFDCRGKCTFRYNFVTSIFRCERQFRYNRDSFRYLTTFLDQIFILTSVKKKQA